MAANQPIYDFTGRQDPGRNLSLLQLLMDQQQAGPYGSSAGQAEAIPASTRRDPLTQVPGWLEQLQQQYPYQPGRPEMGFDPAAAQANIVPGLVERGMDVKTMVEEPVETGVGLAELAKGALQVAGAAPTIAMGSRRAQEAARRRLADNPVAMMLEGGVRELRDLVGEKGVMGALGSMANRPVDVAEMMLGVVPAGAVPRVAKAAKAAKGVKSNPLDFSQDDLIDQAEKQFGITDDWEEAGYLTPHGDLLDFSGKIQGGPAGMRHMDHREVSSLGQDYETGQGPEMLRDATGDLGSSRGYMIDFINRSGAMRVTKATGDLSIDYSQPPTPRQKQMILKEAQNAEYVAIDQIGEDGYSIRSFDKDFPLSSDIAEFLDESTN